LIPAANITAWRRQAPWPDDGQVEQDLILSRMMVEIANHDLLGPELAFRGGTCIHKLHLPTPARYSEDLDYVRRTKSGIKPHLSALAEIASTIGLEEAGTERSGSMVHTKFDATPTAGPGRIRVEVELNIVETEAFLPRVKIPYAIDSPWWQGKAEIGTFPLEELLGTKLRALYQRSKGRDLFDLWHTLTHLDPDADEIVGSFRHYIKQEEFSFPELAQNLLAKLADRDFRDDMTQLVIDLPADYEPKIAADLVMGRLGSHLRNAPDREEIEAGGWRRRKASGRSG
jgi:predicted nucleotidyltransferase component of viral defense system